MVTSWASGHEFSGDFDGDIVAFSMVFCGLLWDNKNHDGQCDGDVDGELWW